MPKLNELLTTRERRFVARLSLVGGILALILIFFFFFWGHRLNQVRSEAVKLTGELNKIVQQNEQYRLDFKRWQQTKVDLEEIKKKALYYGGDGLEAFRQDLKNIIQQAGLQLPPVSYQYEETEKKHFRRLAASFGLNFSYPVFKRFLYQLETWPRLLLLDQINFQEIDNVSGAFQLRITISGYYYEAE